MKTTILGSLSKSMKRRISMRGTSIDVTLKERGSTEERSSDGSQSASSTTLGDSTISTEPFSGATQIIRSAETCGEIAGCALVLLISMGVGIAILYTVRSPNLSSTDVLSRTTREDYTDKRSTLDIAILTGKNCGFPRKNFPRKSFLFWRVW